MEKIYHIYAKDRCIYHSLNEDEFRQVWETLNKLVEIYTEVDNDDLQYEELQLNKSAIAEASYWLTLNITV
jgi:hypothetical protein